MAQEHIRIVCSDISSQVESGRDKSVGHTFERIVNESIDEEFVPLYDTLTTVAAGNVPGRYLCILMENKKEHITNMEK